MNLYAEYITERTNDLIIEDETGFVVYRYLPNGTTVYIVDIFVKEKFRKNGEASRLANKVVEEAKKRECTELLGSVVPSMKYSTRSLQVLLGYKMSLHSADKDFIIFRKEI